MLEQSVVAYCAPTLAGVATGNLFTCRCEHPEELEEQLAQCNKKLNRCGVLVRLLREKDSVALLYVFRPRRLWDDLRSTGTMAFLLSCGYRSGTLCDLIGQLAQRVGENGEFPHEIGLFLGYPLLDVKGFIENKGACYKCVGYWKVYDNENWAKQLFEKYRLCTRVYWKNFVQGMTLQQLTVVA